MRVGCAAHTHSSDTTYVKLTPLSMDRQPVFLPSNVFDVSSRRYKQELPDAYERLLLDAIEGDKRLFLHSDELEQAWALFTPLLQDLERLKVNPEYYPHGSGGPIGAYYLAAKHNMRWGDIDYES